MKLLLMMLLPVFIFSQNQNTYPDTLFMNNGNIFPALVTSLDETIVRIIYAENRNSSSGLNSIDKMYIENFGIVYRNQDGFLTDLDSLQQFIVNRWKKIQEIQELEKEKNTQQDTAITDTEHSDLFSHWSFGILYVPDYSIVLYDYYFDDYSRQLSINARDKEIKVFEGHFNLHLNEHIALTSDFTYKSMNIDERSESRYIYEIYPENSDSSGVKTSQQVSAFYINIGLKYYFYKLEDGKISPLIFASFGKLFIDYSEKSKDLFQSDDDNTPNEVIENNNQKFIEDLNSPFNIKYGFGVEYPFNESVSLYACIRFKYEFRDGKYKYRRVRVDNYSYTVIKNVKIDDFDTHIGIGLNFRID